MYSKQQASQLRQEFWTAFGKYMQPVLSSEGNRVNWINYKSGAKNIFFRTDVGKGVSIAIEITHPANAERLGYYEKFLQLKPLFTGIVREEWDWEPQVTVGQGKHVSRISSMLPGVNVFNRSDWPLIISFLKPRLIALDAFWNMVKHEFDVW